MSAVLRRLAVAIVVAAGCTGDDDRVAESGSASSGALPAAPAGCAGPDAGPAEEHRHDLWSFVGQHLADATGSTAEMWVTFGDVRPPEAVEELVGDVDVTGVFLAFEEQQGTVSKIVDRSHGPLTEQAEAALERRLAASRGEAFEPVDPSVAAGEPPVAGVLLRGDASDLARFVASNRCHVYGVAPASGEPFAVISPRIEPPRP